MKERYIDEFIRGRGISETDSPFTEAGSSICTGRKYFAIIDKETIGRSFKDLIEDMRHITKAEVEERVNHSKKHSKKCRHDIQWNSFYGK